MSRSEYKWRKPKNQANIARVLRKLRDIKLGKFVFQLDRDFPFVFCFDDATDAPVRLSWDTVLSQTADWSDKYGCIGKALSVSLPLGEGVEEVCMVQLGGAITDHKSAAGLPSELEQHSITLHIDDKRIKAVLVTLSEEYFITKKAADEFSKIVELDLSIYTQMEHVKWHRLPRDIWELVLVGIGIKYQLPKVEVEQRRKDITSGLSE
jgi:hypothetical protein